MISRKSIEKIRDYLQKTKEHYENKDVPKALPFMQDMYGGRIAAYDDAIRMIDALLEVNDKED
mgnify:CR=1 FL=1